MNCEFQPFTNVVHCYAIFRRKCHKSNFKLLPRKILLEKENSPKNRFASRGLRSCGGGKCGKYFHSLFSAANQFPDKGKGLLEESKLIINNHNRMIRPEQLSPRHTIKFNKPRNAVSLFSFSFLRRAY